MVKMAKLAGKNENSFFYYFNDDDVNWECVYDYRVTANPEIAKNTKAQDDYWRHLYAGIKPSKFGWGNHVSFCHRNQRKTFVLIGLLEVGTTEQSFSDRSNDGWAGVTTERDLCITRVRVQKMGKTGSLPPLPIKAALADRKKSRK